MICRKPERDPCADGEKVTLTLQEPVEAIEEAQVLVCMKSPETVTVQTVEAVLALFVTVEASALLVVPTI